MAGLNKIFFTSMIFGLLLVGMTQVNCDGESTGNAASDDDDDDNDNDDNNNDDDSVRTMICDEDHLFRYGVKTVTLFDCAEDDTSFIRYTYEYDDEGKRTESVVEYWQGGEVDRSYKRTYQYNKDDLPKRLEWSTDNGPQWRAFSYDKKGRLTKEVYQRELDGEEETLWTDTYDYDDKGRPSRRLYVPGSDTGGQPFGVALKYDKKGRMSKRVVLDPEDDWAETDEVTQFEYDSKGRVEKKITPDGKESVYEYWGETGEISQIVTLGELTESTERFTLEGMVLTSVLVENQDGKEISSRRWEYELTDEANSSFTEVYPIPMITWVEQYYGNGYINGCVDVDED